MSPEQEVLVRETRDATIRMEGQFKLLDERSKKQDEALLNLAKSHYGLERQVNKDRNKVLGALWAFGSALFATILGGIISIFKHS